MNYDKENRVTAKACCVEISCDFSSYNIGQGWVLSEWSIEKADCREVIREHYDIHTATKLAYAFVKDNYYSGVGESKKDAEIQCIVAIVSALEEIKHE